MPRKKKEPMEKEIAEKLIKSKPILVNYTIKAVIPTSPFANIQPEITVFAHTLEAAEQFVLPHIDKLFVKYFNAYLNGVPEVATSQSVKVPPVATTTTTASVLKTNACITAEQAIAGCTSLDALSLVKDRIEKSVKLTAEEKVALAYVLKSKQDEFFTPVA